MKPKAIWIKCNGDAHSNPYIDNCGICMPFWGEYPTCPQCKEKLMATGYCIKCKHHAEVKR